MLAGGLGCFILALLLGEPFLYLSRREPAPKEDVPVSVCLCIDVSGSMAGSKMDEIKSAAKKFISNRDFVEDHLAIVVFSSSANMLVPFSQDAEKLRNNVDSLLPYGGTNFEAALQSSQSTFETLPEGAPKPAAILLFTDGANSTGNPREAARIASALRKKGTRIIAVATEDADFGYLSGLAGGRSNVIKASDGRFEEAFSQAEQMIASSQLMQSDGNEYSFIETILRTSIWSLFLCVGIALALTGLQNYFLKKPLFTQEKLPMLLFAAVLAGLLAGLIGQLAYAGLLHIGLGFLGRILAWSILGTILAFGMVFFIPNLNRKMAPLFGAIGGGFGSIGFMFMTVLTGDMLGRLLGAFILGACIGLLVAIVEQYYRKLWLMVLYTPRDFVQVNLGEEIVTAGSAKEDTVYISSASPQAGRFQLDGNTVRFKDSSGTRNLKPGDRVNISNVELVLCSKEMPFSPSRFYPMRMSKALQLQAMERGN